MKKVNVKQCYIELTSKCNLRCRHCYNDSGVKVNELSFERIKMLVDELERLDNQSIILSGGEPLLYPQIKELLLLLSSKKISVTLVTNSTLIEDGFVRFITNNGINNLRIQISLEGGTRVTNDSIRGDGTFERIMLISEKLQAAHIPFFYHISLNKSSCKEIHDIFTVIKRFKHSFVAFSNLYPYGRLTENMDLLPTSEELYKAIKEIRFLARENNIVVEMPDRLSGGDCPLMSDEDEMTMNPRIDSEGYIYFCQQFNMQELALGNINYTELGGIIESEQMVTLRELMKFRNRHLDDCKSCFARRICKGGCPAIVFSQNKLQGNDGYCDYRKRLCMDQMGL